LAELEETPVDLLITDLKMETMSALEMLPVVQQKFPALPIIVVSGYYKDVQTDFIDKGFKVKAFLPKPVSMSALKEEIRNVLKTDEKGKKGLFKLAVFA
jgi:YesN/AraC family two-component response regulator